MRWILALTVLAVSVIGQSVLATPQLVSEWPTSGNITQQDSIRATMSIEVQAIQIIIDDSGGPPYAQVDNATTISALASGISLGNHFYRIKAWYDNGQNVLSQAFPFTA